MKQHVHKNGPFYTNTQTKQNQSQNKKLNFQMNNEDK